MDDRRAYAGWLYGSAAALLLVVGLVISAALIVMPLGNMAEHTIANSRQIQHEFRAATTFIDGFRSRNGRLPTNAQLERWASRQPQSGYQPFIAQAGHFGDEAIRKLGRPPQGAYTLAVWRGEWAEFYAPWSGSTLSLDERDYLVLGSRTADAILAVFLTLATLLSAKWLWSRGLRKSR